LFIAAIAGLNPVGLDIIHGAFLSDQQSLRNIAQPIAWIGMTILAAAVLLEWIVRTLALKRRLRGLPEPNQSAANRAMRTSFTFFLALLLSVFVALLVVIPLAIKFRTRDESAGVMAALAIFAVISVTALWIVFVRSAYVRVIDWAAAIVVAVVIILVAGLVSAFVFVSGMEVMFDELEIAVQFVAPALLIVLVQWWMVRRRWLRTARLGVT
jgi:hypothetical protein